MSEFEQPEARAGRHKERPPEQYDHHGIWYESPSADHQTRLTMQAEGRKPSVYDLLAIVRGEKEDVKVQRTETMTGQKEMQASEQELTHIQDTLVDIAAGQGADIEPRDKARVLTYLERQQRRWNVKAEAEAKDEDSGEEQRTADEEDRGEEQRATARNHQQLFASFEKEIFSEEKMDAERKAHEEGLEQLEAHANIPHDLKEFAPEHFPAFELHLKETQEFLKQFRKTNKEISLNDIAKFYETLEEDLDSQLPEYKKANPGWVDKKKAVEAAVLFYDQKVKQEVMESGKTQDEVKDELRDKAIFSLVDQSGTASAAWNFPERVPEATKQYAFSLDWHHDSPNSDNYLGTHRNEVTTPKEALQKAQSAVKKIQQDEAIDDKEALPMYQYLDSTRTYLGEGKKKKKDIETLNKMSSLLKEKVSAQRKAQKKAKVKS